MKDNPDDVLLPTMIISRCVPTKVIVRCTGVETCTYFQHNRTARPIVVFLDLRLPDISGIELLEAIRASERPFAQACFL